MVTCLRGVRQLDSHVKGEKHERGVEGMRGEETMNISHTCVRIPHTYVNTHLGLKGD